MSEPSEFRCCVLIPCYNHSVALRAFLPSVLAAGFPVLVVDDGSAADEAAALDALAAANPGVRLLHLPRNGGKGAAMKAGMQEALRLGYTHALQCDADGQHDAGAIPSFVELARKAPGSIIVGTPVYDESVPPARLYGRRITNFFMRLETRGLCQCDGMCGFRVYPLESTLPLLERHCPALRMGFDIQVLVEACWAGIALQDAPVRVTYGGEGSRSHFHMVRDNVRIFGLHTKLCTLAMAGVGRRRKTAGK